MNEQGTAHCNESRFACGRQAISLRSRSTAIWLAAICAMAFALVFATALAAPRHAYASDAVTCKVSGSVNYKKTYKYLAKLNKLRKSKGRKALVMDKALLTAAEQRAAEIAVAYSHTRPNGSKPTTVSKYLVGENIACLSFGSDPYTLWKDSPTHYANMTDSSFKTCGICCLEVNGGSYWVNLFGTTKSGNAKKRSSIKKKTFKVKVAKKYLTKKNLYVVPGTMDADESTRATVYFCPPFADLAGVLPNNLFTFKSSNTSVLSVSKSGVLKSKKEGTAKLTVIPKSKKSCKVIRTITVEGSYYSDDGTDG